MAVVLGTTEEVPAVLVLSSDTTAVSVAWLAVADESVTGGATAVASSAAGVGAVDAVRITAVDALLEACFLELARKRLTWWLRYGRPARVSGYTPGRAKTDSGAYCVRRATGVEGRGRLCQAST